MRPTLVGSLLYTSTLASSICIGLVLYVLSCALSLVLGACGWLLRLVTLRWLTVPVWRGWLLARQLVRRATALGVWLASPVAPFVAAALRSERALLERAAAFQAERAQRAHTEDAQLLRSYDSPASAHDGVLAGGLAAVRAELAKLADVTQAPQLTSASRQPSSAPPHGSLSWQAAAAHPSSRAAEAGADAAADALTPLTTEQLVAALVAARVRSRSVGGAGAGPSVGMVGMVARRSAELSSGGGAAAHVVTAGPVRGSHAGAGAMGAPAKSAALRGARRGSLGSAGGARGGARGVLY